MPEGDMVCLRMGGAGFHAGSAALWCPVGLLLQMTAYLQAHLCQMWPGTNPAPPAGSLSLVQDQGQVPGGAAAVP
jgi:hypothetical protein